jgi:hypothetical protein
MRTRLVVALSALMMTTALMAQNRGVYPLGMSATNSGITPAPGFTYVNQLLYYSRDHATDDNGNPLPVTGENYVLMDMNTIAWVSAARLLGGANFSIVATIPIARNSLTSDINGRISGGGGLADSYYLPLVLGWNRDRVSVRAMYGFLAPTGRFDAEANDNVGSGYWTHTLSSGQTAYLTADKRLALSAFEMFERHTTQDGTGIRPGDTFDIDYSLMRAIETWQFGLVGYNARQISAKTGAGVSPSESHDRYAVNALGFALTSAFPQHKASVGLRYFKEFSNRSTFQGYSIQLSGSIAF